MKPGMILLLSVLIISCLPDNQEPPSPVNTFEVNINAASGGLDTTKTMVIAGDTLLFNLWSAEWYGIQTYFNVGSNAPGFEILHIKHDAFNLLTGTYDTAHYYADASDVNTVDSGIVIDDTYNTYPWMPFTFFEGRYFCPYSKLFQFNADGYPYLIQGMPRNRDQYIVLRKLTGSQYQYYWIRVRNDETAPLVVAGADCRINTRILNGKYQLNGIITGQ